LKAHLLQLLLLLQFTENPNDVSQVNLLLLSCTERAPAADSVSRYGTLANHQ
jgi:hypothetical protein